MKNIIILLLFIPFLGIAQQNEITKDLSSEYENYKELKLTKRRVKHAEIQPLINSLKAEKGFEVRTLGKSIEGREIRMISLGEGKTDVLLWSQMHGNEPTATMAIFDMLNYFKSNKEILKKVKLHFIPMLNPDGAEKFKRRNAIDIDINRDALRLQSPESRILKSVRDSLQADFGFNLHDQSIHYNAEQTSKPATISFLAPAYNYKKDINDVRGNAMKIIVEMNNVIQNYAPGQVGRYSDDFEPRAFGDNIQKWGTSTILVESGGYLNDPEKQVIRKLNYISILAAINSISNETYKSVDINRYEEIPKNDRKLFDLKIENLTFTYLGKEYLVDLGINRSEKDNPKHTDYYSVGKISDIGDLSTFYGYKTIDAKNLIFKSDEVYPKIISDANELKKINFVDLLKQGYTSIAVEELDKKIKFTEFPMNITKVNGNYIQKMGIPKPPLNLNKNATFLLKKDGKVAYAIINGFVYDLQNNRNDVRNGIVK
ncbi:MAG: M14 metallopeptidase family protein [Bacteroidota bacterium]